jgi:hypothetical protein
MNASAPLSHDGVFHREVYGGLIEGSATPLTRHLFLKWIDISRVRKPSYGDFLPDSNPRVAEGVMVLLAADSGDFTYLQVGPTIARLIGRDLTGKTVSGVEGQVMRHIERVYQRVRDGFVPCHTMFHANFRDIVDLWERIVLPVQAAPESGPTLLLLYSEAVNLRADMLERALGMIDHAVLCARPLFDASGAIVDAAVTFSNRAARNLFGIDDERPDVLARSLPFLFCDDELWRQLTVPRPEESRTVWHKHAQTQADYMISTRLSGDHLIFSVTPVGNAPGDVVWI